MFLASIMWCVLFDLFSVCPYIAISLVYSIWIGFIFQILCRNLAQKHILFTCLGQVPRKRINLMRGWVWRTSRFCCLVFCLGCVFPVYVFIMFRPNIPVYLFSLKHFYHEWLLNFAKGCFYVVFSFSLKF